MKVYIVMEMYRDYDENWNDVVSVHVRYEDAFQMRNAADMACELTYVHADSLKGTKDAPFLWGRYDNYYYSINEYETEE